MVPWLSLAILLAFLLCAGGPIVINRHFGTPGLLAVFGGLVVMHFVWNWPQRVQTRPVPGIFLVGAALFFCASCVVVAYDLLGIWLFVALVAGLFVMNVVWILRRRDKSNFDDIDEDAWERAETEMAEVLRGATFELHSVTKAKKPRKRWFEDPMDEYEYQERVANRSWFHLDITVTPKSPSEESELTQWDPRRLFLLPPSEGSIEGIEFWSEDDFYRTPREICDGEQRLRLLVAGKPHRGCRISYRDIELTGTVELPEE